VLTRRSPQSLIKWPNRRVTRPSNRFNVEENGRATAQAVSRWLPTTAARVLARVRLRGICGGQSGTVAGFLRVLRFPLPIFIPPTAPQSPSSIIWGWYNRPVVAAVRSGLTLTPLRSKKKNFETGPPSLTRSRLWLCSPFLDLGRFSSFLILYEVGRTPWTEEQPVARPLPTHGTTQTQTSMP
jgi:hypothetical protein